VEVVVGIWVLFFISSSSNVWNSVGRRVRERLNNAGTRQLPLTAWAIAAKHTRDFGWTFEPSCVEHIEESQFGMKV
jgi:hypothetical protein